MSKSDNDNELSDLRSELARAKDRNINKAVAILKRRNEMSKSDNDNDSELSDLRSELARAKDRNINKAVASVAVCVAGAFAMYITDGSTGIGWAIFGLFIIWQ